MKLTKEQVETYFEKPYNASISELSRTILTLYAELEKAQGEIAELKILTRTYLCAKDKWVYRDLRNFGYLTTILKDAEENLRTAVKGKDDG